MEVEIQEVRQGLAVAAATARRLLSRAWARFLGLFSHNARFFADMLTALERGEGSIVFFWYCDGDDENDETDDGEIVPPGMLADIDNAIRRMPSPLGVDEFFVNVAVYGPRPQDRDSFEVTTEGRRLLRVEHLPLLDRYYDWKRGNGQEQLRQSLARNVPSPDAPLVVVQILSLGSALATLLRTGRWQPVSPWLR